MLNKLIILTFLFGLDAWLLHSQVIHYDYDNSGNRLKRYIILQKSLNTTTDTSLAEVKENNKIDDLEETLADMKIKIYPNPTRGQLVVEISGLVQDETADYQLFSQTGMLLDTKRKNGFTFIVDMGKYPGGFYILRLMINGKISQWKILKE